MMDNEHEHENTQQEGAGEPQSTTSAEPTPAVTDPHEQQPSIEQQQSGSNAVPVDPTGTQSEDARSSQDGGDTQTPVRPEGDSSQQVAERATDDRDVSAAADIHSQTEDTPQAAEVEPDGGEPGGTQH